MRKIFAVKATIIWVSEVLVCLELEHEPKPNTFYATRHKENLFIPNRSTKPMFFYGVGDDFHDLEIIAIFEEHSSE